MPKNWCFWTVVRENLLEIPLDCKEIKPVNPKVNNPEYSLEGLMPKLNEAPGLWPTDAKSRLIRRDPDAGKDWKQEDKWMTEDEMVGWHHWLSGHEFVQTLGDGEGRGSLACCSLWGRKESDTIEWLSMVPNWVTCASESRLELDTWTTGEQSWRWPASPWCSGDLAFVGPHRKALFNLRWLILWQDSPQVLLVQRLISSFLKSGTRWFSLPP